MRVILTTLSEAVEIGLHWLGAIAGLGTLTYAIGNMLWAQARPSGLQTGVARKALRTPYLVVATLLFVWGAYLLWKPLPLQLTVEVRLILTVVGSIIFFPSLVVYIWGLQTLGSSFNVSSGFGVRLNQEHQLVTHGPFAYLRHPMYLAVILAFCGGLLIYHTWSMLVMAVIMFGLIYRGYTEEKALAQAFGSEWLEYKQRVPGWLPRLKNRANKDKL